MRSSREAGLDDVGELGAFDQGTVDVVGLIAVHSPINATLLAICRLIERTFPGSQCVIIRRLADDSLDFVSPTGVPSALADALRSRFTTAFQRPGAADVEERRVEIPDPTRAPTHSIWCLPVVGLGRAPLGALCVSREWAAPSEREFGMVDHARRLLQIALEQHQAAQNFASTIAAEREQLANELHDDPIQAITVLSLLLQRLARDLPPGSRESVQAARETADAAIDRMRRMLFELHPYGLDDEGLVGAVEVYLEQSMEPLGLAWTVDDELAAEPDAATATLAFRLVHEALSNVAAHSQAASVSVSFRNERGGLAIGVTDDGIGFDPATIPPHRPGHLGISNAQYLARHNAGRLEVTSTPGSGCRIDIWVPLDVAGSAPL